MRKTLKAVQHKNKKKCLDTTIFGSDGGKHMMPRRTGVYVVDRHFEGQVKCYWTHFTLVLVSVGRSWWLVGCDDWRFSSLHQNMQRGLGLTIKAGFLLRSGEEPMKGTFKHWRLMTLVSVAVGVRSKWSSETHYTSARVGEWSDSGPAYHIHHFYWIVMFHKCQLENCTQHYQHAETRELGFALRWRNTPLLFVMHKHSDNPPVPPARGCGSSNSQSHIPDLNPAHTSLHPPSFFQTPCRSDQNPFSSPTLNPICTLHPRLSSQPVRGWLPMSITEWWMRWKVVTPLCRVQWSHQPCRHLQTREASEIIHLL